MSVHLFFFVFMMLIIIAKSLSKVWSKDLERCSSPLRSKTVGSLSQANEDSNTDLALTGRIFLRQNITLSSYFSSTCQGNIKLTPPSQADPPHHGHTSPLTNPRHRNQHRSHRHPRHLLRRPSPRHPHLSSRHHLLPINQSHPQPHGTRTPPPRPRQNHARLRPRRRRRSRERSLRYQFRSSRPFTSTSTTCFQTATSEERDLR